MSPSKVEMTRAHAIDAYHILIQPLDVSNYTTQSIASAIYYSYRAELVSCFVISCLPAVKQLVERKIVPSVTRYTITLSSKLKSSKKDDNEI